MADSKPANKESGTVLMTCESASTEEHDMQMICKPGDADEETLSWQPWAWQCSPTSQVHEWTMQSIHVLMKGRKFVSGLYTEHVSARKFIHETWGPCGKSKELGTCNILPKS